MGKTIEQIYGKTDEELLIYFKDEILKLYGKNNKLTSRMIDKDRNNGLPTMNFFKKYLTKFNIPGTGIEQIYNFIGIEIPRNIKNLAERHKYTYTELKAVFEAMGYTLLSSDFNTVFDKVDYTCICGTKHNKKISDILNGSQCPKCGKENQIKKRRLSENELNKRYEKYGCELLSQYSDYKNMNSILTFKCKCGNIDTKSFATFRITGKCEECSRQFVRGENHYAYKGGISPLHEHLRRRIYDWKMDSMKFFNFKCVLTSSQEFVVHHLYKNFSEILTETIEICKLPIYEAISDYKEEELRLLETTCLNLHRKYGHGIVINVELHKLFHKEYGLNNNTKYQFIEFVSKLESGYYNDQLDMLDLTLFPNRELLNLITE